MSEENKNNSKSKEGSCCRTGCCGGKKLVVGLLVGTFIFFAGYWFAKANVCVTKICPWAQMQIQK